MGDAAVLHHTKVQSRLSFPIGPAIIGEEVHSQQAFLLLAMKGEEQRAVTSGDGHGVHPTHGGVPFPGVGERPQWGGDPAAGGAWREIKHTG